MVVLSVTALGSIKLIAKTIVDENQEQVKEHNVVFDL